MQITLEVPDDLAATLAAPGQDPARAALEALALEASIFGRLCATEDKREGTRAFLEKRPATWLGR